MKYAHQYVHHKMMAIHYIARKFINIEKKSQMFWGREVCVHFAFITLSLCIDQVNEIWRHHFAHRSFVRNMWNRLCGCKSTYLANYCNIIFHFLIMCLVENAALLTRWFLGTFMVRYLLYVGGSTWNVIYLAVYSYIFIAVKPYESLLNHR